MNIPLNIDWQQILLHLLNFAILAGGLYILLYKPVKKFMNQRVEYYKKMEEDSQEKLSEAQDLKSSYENQFSNAEEEIAAMRANILKEAEDEAENQLQSAKEQSKKIITDAQKKARDERQRILAGAQKDITKLAVSAAQKVLESSDDMYDQFIDAAREGEAHEGK